MQCLHQEKTKPGNIGNQKQGKNQHKHPGPSRFRHLPQSHTRQPRRNIEIQSNRRCDHTYFHIGRHDNTQVYWIDTQADCDRMEQRRKYKHGHP